MRFSSKTGWILLLAMLLGSGIAAWNEWHPDGCYRYMHGDLTQLSSQTVEMGAASVSVPCDQWYPRQGIYMQGACVAEGAAIALLLLLLVGDVVNWRRQRMGLRRVK